MHYQREIDDTYLLQSPADSFCISVEIAQIPRVYRSKDLNIVGLSLINYNVTNKPLEKYWKLAKVAF